MNPERVVTHRNRHGAFSFLANDEYIGGRLREGEPWAPEIVDYAMSLLAPTDVVVDAGAHVGCFAIPISRRCRTVHAFEAQRTMHALLEANLRANGIANVVASHLALGDRRGYARLRATLDDGTHRTVDYDTAQPVNYGGVAIETSAAPTDLAVATLDELGIAPQLIKLDVEGHEDRVVAGARRTIAECKPVIVYERNAKYRPQEGVEDLEAALAGDYDPPVALIRGNDYVLFPQHPLELPARMTDGMASTITITDRQFEIANGGRVRGPFRLCTPRAGHVRVHFDDIGQAVDGIVGGGRIRWANGVAWTLAR